MGWLWKQNLWSNVNDLPAEFYRDTRADEISRDVLSIVNLKPNIHVTALGGKLDDTSDELKKSPQFFQHTQGRIKNEVTALGGNLDDATGI